MSIETFSKNVEGYKDDSAKVCRNYIYVGACRDGSMQAKQVIQRPE